VRILDGIFLNFRVNYAYIAKIMTESRTMLDKTDSRLLQALQKNAHLTAQQLGELLNLSPSQAGRRRQRLEDDGYITGFHARIDPQRLGLAVQAFVQIAVVNHAPEAARSFQTLIRARHDIVAAWTLTGEADFLLRVYCSDLSELNRLVQDVFLPHPAVARVQSQIVMEQTKPDAPLPI